MTAMPAFATVFRFTLVDGLRSRWGLVMLALVAAGFVLAGYGASLAITETASVAIAATAPLLRIAAVATVVVFVAAAAVHEIGERALLLSLAAPLPRAGWVLAKAAGFSVLATLTALACAVPVIATLPPGTAAGAAAWTLSLAMELTLVGGIALMMSVALRQVPATILATGACYLLARVVGSVLMLVERAPLAEQPVIAGTGLFAVKAVAALMPRVDLFTQSGWLLGESPVDLPAVAGQTALYALLVLTIASIDFDGRDA